MQVFSIFIPQLKLMVVLMPFFLTCGELTWVVTGIIFLFIIFYYSFIRLYIFVWSFVLLILNLSFRPYRVFSRQLLTLNFMVEKTLHFQYKLFVSLYIIINIFDTF